MLGKIVIRLFYLVAGASLTLLFLMFAQVNVDDLRHSMGNLRIVPDPLIQLGSFYSIKENGSLSGPHCSLPEEAVAAHVQESQSSITLSKKLLDSLVIGLF